MRIHDEGAQAPIIPRKIDQPWHDAILKALPWQQQMTARQGYQDVFQETWDSLPDDHRRANAAARAANLRLLMYATKILGRQAVERITSGAGRR